MTNVQTRKSNATKLKLRKQVAITLNSLTVVNQWRKIQLSLWAKKILCNISDLWTKIDTQLPIQMIVFKETSWKYELLRAKLKDSEDHTWLAGYMVYISVINKRKKPKPQLDIAVVPNLFQLMYPQAEKTRVNLNVRRFFTYTVADPIKLFVFVFQFSYLVWVFCYI